MTFKQKVSVVSLVVLFELLVLAVAYGPAANAIQPKGRPKGQEGQGQQIVVLFQRGGSGSGVQQMVSAALRKTLREKGYQPVFTDRNGSQINSSNTRRVFDRLPRSVDLVLVINDIRVTNQSSGQMNIRHSGSGPRFRYSSRGRGKVVYLSGELVDANTEISLKSAEATGRVGDGGLRIDAGGFGISTRSNDNLRYLAVQKAAKKLVENLK